ncbi:hypothetical protein, partial [Lacticaseibacillus paracasei]
MTDKRETLMSMLSKAYANPTIKAEPALRALIETNAKKVDEGDDDKAYVTAVTQLSHDISKYYLIHHAVPEELVAVFNYDGFTIQVQQTSQIEKTHRLSPCKMESPQDQLQGELDYESVHPSYL